MVSSPKPERMIKAGLLPENLPPSYSSASIWSHYEPHLGSYLVTKKSVGSPSIYNSSKRGHQRRIFGLPHPTFVFDQAGFFERHWTALDPLFSRSPGSQSVPIVSEVGARAIRITPHSELPKARLRSFSRDRFCLVTDVARFFPSIYTHAIPWAINGRSAAKKDTNATSAAVFGNRLDFIGRQSQDRQTVGIPVGPDTSKIVSELVLSAVDEALVAASGDTLRYIRHVDDYWIGGKTVEECEHHLQVLRGCLRAYELDTNELKTRILSTNYILGETWPGDFEKELRDGLTSRTGPSADADAVAVLSRIIDRATKDNDDGMIRFAIKRIDERHLWKISWDILEHFIAQCAVQFSHSIDYVARVVSWRARMGETYDRALWTDVAISVAGEGAALGRDSEVVWALWLMKELKIKIPKRLSTKIVQHNSPIVLGYLAHFHAHNLTNAKDLASTLWERVEGSVYAEQSWPLALELMHLQIADPQTGRPTSDDALRLLHDNGASLIDWDAAPKVFSTREPGDDDDPDFAIEDFAGDYGGDAEGDEEDEGPLAVDESAF